MASQPRSACPDILLVRDRLHKVSAPIRVVGSGWYSFNSQMSDSCKDHNTFPPSVLDAFGRRTVHA